MQLYLDDTQCLYLYLSWRGADDMQCRHCLPVTDGVSSFTAPHTQEALPREESYQG